MVSLGFCVSTGRVRTTVTQEQSKAPTSVSGGHLPLAGHDRGDMTYLLVRLSVQAEYSAMIPGGDVAALWFTLLKKMAAGMSLELSQGPCHEANIGIPGVR